MSDVLMDEFNDKEVESYFEKGGEDDNQDLSDAQDEDQSQGEEDQQQATNSEETETQEKELQEETPSQDSQKQDDTERLRSMAESERIKRKEFQKQLDALKGENENLKSTFDKILKKAQEQSQDPAPSFDDDPVAALKYENEQLKKQMADFNSYKDQQIQQTEQQRGYQQFVQNYQQKAAEFSQEHPDFNDAYKYALECRLSDYKSLGYTDQQARQLVGDDEKAIAARALQEGDNPAESIYNFAKSRGFNGQQQPQQQSPQDKIAANNEKIAKLEKGIEASKSIHSGGGQPVKDFSLSDVANMDDDDFDKVDWSKVLKMG